MIILFYVVEYRTRIKNHLDRKKSLIQLVCSSRYCSLLWVMTTRLHFDGYFLSLFIYLFFYYFPFSALTPIKIVQIPVHIYCSEVGVLRTASQLGCRLLTLFFFILQSKSLIIWSIDRFKISIYERTRRLCLQIHNSRIIISQ